MALSGVRRFRLMSRHRPVVSLMPAGRASAGPWTSGWMYRRRSPDVGRSASAARRWSRGAVIGPPPRPWFGSPSTVSRGAKHGPPAATGARFNKHGLRAQPIAGARAGPQLGGGHTGRRNRSPPPLPLARCSAGGGARCWTAAALPGRPAQFRGPRRSEQVSGDDGRGQKWCAALWWTAAPLDGTMNDRRGGGGGGVPLPIQLFLWRQTRYAPSSPADRTARSGLTVISAELLHKNVCFIVPISPCGYPSS